MPGSPKSDTRVTNEETNRTIKNFSYQSIVNACAAAAEDLTETRRLAEALDKENTLLSERLETARQSSALLKELKETRKGETDALKAVIAAKNETITAKEAVIIKQDNLIRELKIKKTSPWKRLGDVLLGVAIFAVLK